MNSDMVSNV